MRETLEALFPFIVDADVGIVLTKTTEGHITSGKAKKKEQRHPQVKLNIKLKI